MLPWICSYGYAPPNYGYAVMDMFLSTVDMLPPATNMLLSTTVDTSRVTEGCQKNTPVSTQPAIQ